MERRPLACSLMPKFLSKDLLSSKLPTIVRNKARPKHTLSSVNRSFDEFVYNFPRTKHGPLYNEGYSVNKSFRKAQPKKVITFSQVLPLEKALAGLRALKKIELKIQPQKKKHKRPQAHNRIFSTISSEDIVLKEKEYSQRLVRLLKSVPRSHFHSFSGENVKQEAPWRKHEGVLPVTAIKKSYFRNDEYNLGSMIISSMNSHKGTSRHYPKFPMKTSHDQDKSGDSFNGTSTLETTNKELKEISKVQPIKEKPNKRVIVFQRKSRSHIFTDEETNKIRYNFLMT